MLEKFKAFVPVTEGMDTKSDDRFIVPGKVKLVENGVYRKKGRVDKRYGYTSFNKLDIDGSSILDDAKGLYKYGDELLVEGDGKLYSRSSDVGRWVEKNTFIRTSLTSTQITRNQDEQVNLSSAHIGNLAVYAWEDSRDSTSVRYSVKDTAADTFIVFDQQLDASGERPIVVTTSTHFHVVYKNSTNIDVKTIAAATPGTLSSATNAATGLNSTTPSFDAYSVNDMVYIAFYENSSNDIELYQFASNDFSTTNDTYQVQSNVTTTGPLSITSTEFSSTTYIHVGWYKDSDSKLHVAIVGEDLSVVAADNSSTTTYSATPALLTGSQFRSTAHTVQWFASPALSATIRSNSVTVIRMSTSAQAGTSFTEEGFILVSDAFYISDDSFIAIANIPTEQATVYLVNVDSVNNNFNLITKMSQSETGTSSSTDRQSTVTVSGNTAYFGFNKVGEYTVEDNRVVTTLGFSEASINFDPAIQASSAYLNGNLYIAGGLLRNYDGVSATEHGFAYYPNLISAQQTAGSGSLPTAVLNYHATYEWLDNAGNLHRSAPTTTGVSFDNDPAVTNVVVIKVTSQALTQKAQDRSPPRLILWRESGNGTYYKNNTSNDATAIPSAGLQDNDANDTTAEILYTTGGIIENIQPPACDIVAAHQDRLFVAGLEDRNKIWYSKPLQKAVGIGFNDSFQMDIDPDGGDITALVSMDNRLIIFQERAIRWISGEGPNALGVGSFTPPQLVSNDIGAQNHQSAILTPLGVIFKSSKGVWLLSRGMELSYIGESIEDYNSNTVSSSVIIDDLNEVRMTTLEGQVLVYNYNQNKWSVFTGLGAVGGVVWQNQHTIVGSTGTVKQQSSSSYLDDSTFVQLKIKTGWIQTDEIAGLQRIYKVQGVGKYYTPHDLEIVISYNYDDSTTETHTASVTSDPKEYIFECRHRTQKCTAVQYTIQDAEPTSGVGTGQGASFSGLKLQFGAKRSLSLQPSTRRL